MNENKIINVSIDLINETFPDIPEYEILSDKSMLKMTVTSIYSVSKKNGASKLCELIYKKMKTTEIIITDGTANVGSDTIMLAKYFKK